MRQIFYILNIVIRNQRPNFNNPDGSFNKDAWIDFMNTAIQSIPYINTWTGHTVGLVNQQSKVIDWSSSFCTRKRINQTLPSIKKYQSFEIWDSEIGWTKPNGNPIDYIESYDFETTKIKLFKVYDTGFGSGQNIKFLVIYPDKTWRYLGFWEYAQYGLKKYIPFKVQDQLKKLGVL